jgi:hypothetical protein
MPEAESNESGGKSVAHDRDLFNVRHTGGPGKGRFDSSPQPHRNATLMVTKIVPNRAGRAKRLK